MTQRRIVVGTLAAIAGLGLARDVRAQQIDVNPPMPNVMVLLDTSGSMEKMPDGTSGSRLRRSMTVNIASSTATAANEPTVRAEPQPACCADTTV